MRKLIVAVAILIGLALVADLLSRMWVEHRLEERVAANISGVSQVDASIESFPFLGRLAWKGEVTRSRLVLHDVVGVGGIDLAELRLEVDGARFDRASLFRGDRVELKEISRVEVTALITDRTLAAITHVGVVLAPNVVRITAAGKTVTARVEASKGRLRFHADGLPAVTLALPTAEVLPCVPDVQVLDRQLRLRCTATELPPYVLDAVSTLATNQ